MGLEAPSKIYPHKQSKTEYLTIPGEIANDSAYPFQKVKSVVVKIDVENDRLIIEKR